MFSLFFTHRLSSVPSYVYDQHIPQIWIDKNSGFMLVVRFWEIDCPAPPGPLLRTVMAAVLGLMERAPQHMSLDNAFLSVALLILLEGLKVGYHQFLDSLFLFIPRLNDGSRNQNYIEHWFLLFGQLPKPWAFGRMGTNFLISAKFYGK